MAAEATQPQLPEHQLTMDPTEDVSAKDALPHLQTLNLISSQLSTIATEILNTKLQRVTNNSLSDPESQSIPTATSLFATLKSVNRSSSANVGECKTKANQARSELDSIHLGLQNLVYERRHLEREIKKCREFE